MLRKWYTPESTCFWNKSEEEEPEESSCDVETIPAFPEANAIQCEATINADLTVEQ